MTDNVVSLTGHQIDGEPCQEVIEVLEEALDSARRGEITAIAGAWLTANEKAFTFEAGNRFTALVGGLELAKYDMIRKVEALDG
jgi:hypothetical protein